MAHGCLSYTVRGVPALEYAHQPASAPRLRARNQRTRKRFEVIELQSETAEWILGERIEPGGNDDEIGDEPLGCLIDSALERRQVLRARESGALRDVPDGAVRSSVVLGTGTWIPRPLVHGYEMNVWLSLDQSLSSIPVVDVPIHDEHSGKSVFVACVVSCDCRVPEQAETHAAVAHRVVPGWSNRAEAPRMAAAYRVIDRVERASRSRRRGVPGSRARDSVSIEPSTSSFGEISDRLHVRTVMGQSDLLERRMASFEVINPMKDFGLFTKGACNRTQATDVFRMSPSGVVPAAIAVGNERRPHGRAGVTQPVAGGGP